MQGFKNVEKLTWWLLLSSEPKWNYSRHTTTWQITPLYGRPEPTWNRGVVEQAESDQDLPSIFAAEQELQGKNLWEVPLSAIILIKISKIF